MREISDVIGSVLARPDTAEGHIGPHDLQLVAVRVLDDVQCDMRVGRLDVIGELDVLELGTADHPFLLGNRQGLPAAMSCTYFWTCT